MKDIGEYSLAWDLLESGVLVPRLGSIQQPIGSSAGIPQAKQPTRQEHSPPHPPSADKLFKVFLSTALLTGGTRHCSTYQRARTSPFNEEACTILLASSTRGPTEEPRTTTCTLQNGNHNHKKLDKRTQQRNMSQMKEQDKTSEEQLSDVEIGNLPETKFRVAIVKMIQGL